MTSPLPKSSDSELSSQKSPTIPDDLMSSSKTPESLAPAAMKFERWDGSRFSVDWSTEGADIIYHFWPPGGDRTLSDDLLNVLARVFRSTLPPHVQPVGEFDSADDQETRYRVGEPAITRPDGKEKLFQDTVWIRVPGILNELGAETMMFERLFSRLDVEPVE
jgi:hypothetical protein